MAINFKPKRTTTVGNVPSTANLAAGEIAINLADKKLFVRDTSNNILELTTRSVNSLDDVNISGLSNNQVLQYSASTSKWENTTLTNIWSDSGTYIYNTSTVGIGTATPNTDYKLDVNGTVNCTTLYVGGVQVDGGSPPFLLTKPVITTNYTVAANFNASTTGVVDVATGITLEVGDNANLTISS
jgi:hypothetical protein